MCRPTYTVTQEQPHTGSTQRLHQSKRLPLIRRNPRFIAFHPSACNLFSRRLQTVAVLRSKQSCGPSFEGGRQKKITNKGSWRVRMELGLLLVQIGLGIIQNYGSLLATRPWKPLCLCIWNKQLKPDKKQNVWGWGTAGKLRGGISRYGVVWFGWRCFCRPSPRPLPPVPPRGPSWEGPLFWAGRRTSEWMSKSSGGLLQWRLFVYTSQSRHTSLAAQPTDNLWCPNRRQACSCPSTQSLGGSG